MISKSMDGRIEQGSNLNVHIADFSFGGLAHRPQLQRVYKGFCREEERADRI